MDPEITYLAADGLHYGTDEAQFSLYNFQPPQTIDELIKFAQSPCPHGHLVELRGPQGIGKQYLLRAAAYRGSEQGKTTLCTVLQLPNRYDPTTSSDPALFIEQLKETHPYLHSPSYSERLTRIKETFHKHKNSIVNATAATLMATMNIPDLLGSAVLNSILSLWTDSRSGNHLDFTPEEQFYRFLKRITDNHHLFLYVPDDGRNSLEVFNWALDCLARLPSLTMVVGLEPGTASPLYRGKSPYTITVSPYQESYVAALLNQKVPDATLPPTFVQAFTRHTGGYPGYMALLFAQCTQQNLFSCEMPEHNLFADTDTTSENELAAIFIHGGLYAPISNLRKTIYATTGDRRGHVLDSFLRLAAACGEYIPFDWIVDCLALASEDSDWLEDRLTDDLKECFTYRGVELNAFPNCEIYQLTNPWLSVTITQALGKDLVQQEARKFTLYLSAQVRPTSEEGAKLFAAVFQAAGQENESFQMNLLLNCWIGYWNASALKERLIAQLGEQRLRPDRLWSIIKTTDGTWPSWRRLVLLEAYGEYPGGMPDDHRIPWQSDVGICLLESGQYEDARQVFQDLLNSHAATDEYLVKALFLSCLGSVEIYLGQAHLALPYLHEAATIQQTALPPLHPALAATLNSLGDCFRELGRPQEALEKLEEAETIQRTALPPLHHALALTLNTLGNCLRDLSRPLDALDKLEEAETIQRTALPPLHPHLALTLNNLGLCLHDLGRPLDALEKLEEALMIRRTILPPLHPHLALTLYLLGSCLLDLDRPQEALGKLEEAETIRRTALPPLHPALAATLTNLGDCLHKLNRTQEALEKLEEAEIIQRTTLPSLHPCLAMTLYHLGSCLHELSRSLAALEKLEEAETIQRTVLPPLHPHLALTLSNLGLCLHELGHPLDALGKLEEAEAIQRTALPALNPHLAVTLGNLGGCLRHLDRPQEALGKWDEARTLFQSHGSQFEGLIQQLTQRIAQIKGNV